MNAGHDDGRARSFHTRTRADFWEDGLVVGTGRIGGILHGGGERHVIDLAHEEFFLRVNPAPPAPHLAPHLPSLRHLLMDGRAAEAAAQLDGLVEEYLAGDMYRTDPFVPASSIVIDAHDAGEVSDYVRGANFTTSTADATWTDSNHGRQQLALTADRLASRLRVRLTSERPRTVRIAIGRGTTRIVSGVGVGAPDYFEAATAAASASRDSLALRVDGRAAPGAAGHAAHTELTCTRFATTEAESDHAWATLALAPGEVVEIEVALVHTGAPVAPPALAPRAASSHRELIERSTLDLGAHAQHRVPTEQLFERARGGDTAATDALLELAYHAGRYNIISSSGELPPNLVGVWQGTWAPAWSGDYTLNGNVTFGGVAALVSTGTPELLLALFRLLQRFEDDFADNARLIYAAEGYLVPARVSTHGRANHFNADYPHEFWIGGGAWMLRQSFEYFSATGDALFLEWAWPFACEVMSFYESALAPGADGLLHAVPSYSPENTPHDRPTALTVDATAEIASIRDAIVVASRFARIVGEPERISAWSALRERLPAYRITAEGTLAEWIDPATPDEPAHRHQSHLYALSYEGDEEFLDPALRAAALASAWERLRWREEEPSGPPGRMEMAFGLAQLGVIGARLGDAELALRSAIWLARDHWQPSMVSTHDAGSLFNMDASGGLPAVIAAMFLRTEPGEATLLPSLPSRWAQGSITGLAGHDGLIVDELRWSPTGARAVLRRRAGSTAARTTDLLTLNAGAGWIVPGDRRRTIGEQPVVIELERAGTRTGTGTG